MEAVPHTPLPRRRARWRMFGRSALSETPAATGPRCGGACRETLRPAPARSTCRLRGPPPTRSSAPCESPAPPPVPGGGSSRVGPDDNGHHRRPGFFHAKRICLHGFRSGRERDLLSVGRFSRLAPGRRDVIRIAQLELSGPVNVGAKANSKPNCRSLYRRTEELHVGDFNRLFGIGIFAVWL